jgi:hypothetical protein
MSWSWPRWNLRHLVIAIAILAVSFAVLGVAGTAVMALFFSPAAFTRPGRRMDALYWMATSYPIVCLFSLYLTWMGAWFALGHPARPSLDDPKDIDAVTVPYVLTAILLFSSPFALVISLGLMVERVVRRSRTSAHWLARSAPLLVVPLAWAIGYGFLRSDPGCVFNWYMD